MVQFSKPCVYVIKCKRPNTYYVGSTYRPFYLRLNEHKEKHCIWTARHGFDKVVARIPSSLEELGKLENEVWMYYARHICGPDNVRGGDVTWCQTPDIPAWIMPEEFGGTRRVDW